MAMEAETPVLDLINGMTASSIEAADLTPETLMLVRFAALVAVQAPPASYVTNLAVAEDVGVDVESLRAVLLAVAPIVGTPRVVAAIGNIARGLGMVLEANDVDTD
jgi:hypothetical protein